MLGLEEDETLGEVIAVRYRYFGDVMLEWKGIMS